ncbi:ELWxxDGT repeat protein [Pyxidicoccus trucidator]|uniref:ELWxxDGT repeat protein n=1 Tax=Pyxidicoccus trucidator TaxID=2709662 RepID=UPI0013DC5D3B|nr:ELWxxDGT repeat protein [Pyxidicoccus trucidator]
MKCWPALPLALALLSGCTEQDAGRPAQHEGGAGSVAAQAASTWEPCGTTPEALGTGLPGTAPEPRDPVHANGLLFFFAGDDASGGSLWVTSGTQGAGTFKVKDFAPGPTGTPPMQLTRVGERVFFAAEEAEHGRELWVSDGTPAGTRLVADIWPGPTGSFPRSMFEHQGRLYFTAGDEEHGRELWMSDGTAAGTALVADLDPGAEGTNPDLFARSSDGSIYFIAHFEAFFTTVMRLGASGPPTELMRMSSEGAVLGAPTPVGRRVFFVMGDLHGHKLKLMVTEGGAPKMVAEFTHAGEMLAMGGKLYFAAATDMAGEDMELWRSDGTPKGTWRVKDVHPGDMGSMPGEFSVFGQRLVFSAEDGTNGREPWVSDGTVAGTRLLADVEPGEGSSFPERMVALQGNLFFSAETSGRGREAWMSNGQAGGTVPIDDLSPGAKGSEPRGFVRSGWDAFFTAEDGAGVRKLWALPLRPEGRCGPSAL